MASLLVFLQFLFLAICLYPWPNPFQLNWGLSLIVAAVFLGLSSLFFNRPGNFNIRPVYKPNGELILIGTYRFFRHPMYVSVLMAGLGAVVLQMHFLKMISVVILFLVLEMKARIEEQVMLKQFPEYSNYLKHSKRWLPFNFKQKEK